MEDSEGLYLPQGTDPEVSGAQVSEEDGETNALQKSYPLGTDDVWNAGMSGGGSGEPAENNPGPSLCKQDIDTANAEAMVSTCRQLFHPTDPHDEILKPRETMAAVAEDQQKLQEAERRLSSSSQAFDNIMTGLVNQVGKSEAYKKLKNVEALAASRSDGTEPTAVASLPKRDLALYNAYLSREKHQNIRRELLKSMNTRNGNCNDPIRRVLRSERNALDNALALTEFAERFNLPGAADLCKRLRDPQTCMKNAREALGKARQRETAAEKEYKDLQDDIRDNYGEELLQKFLSDLSSAQPADREGEKYLALAESQQSVRAAKEARCSAEADLHELGRKLSGLESVAARMETNADIARQLFKLVRDKLHPEWPSKQQKKAGASKTGKYEEGVETKETSIPESTGGSPQQQNGISAPCPSPFQPANLPGQGDEGPQGAKPGNGWRVVRNGKGFKFR